MIELINERETYAVIGAAMEVHNVLGCGFLEAIYQEALELEFASQRIPYVAQKELPVLYKGRRLNKVYIADFVVFEKIIVEIKALDQFDYPGNCATHELSQSYRARGRPPIKLWI